MFHEGIDISKFEYDCLIATDAGVKISSFTFMNDKEGFQKLKNELSNLSDSDQIKIVIESPVYYGINSKSF